MDWFTNRCKLKGCRSPASAGLSVGWRFRLVETQNLADAIYLTTQAANFSCFGALHPSPESADG